MAFSPIFKFPTQTWHLAHGICMSTELMMELMSIKALALQCVQLTTPTRMAQTVNLLNTTLTYATLEPWREKWMSLLLQIVRIYISKPASIQKCFAHGNNSLNFNTTDIISSSVDNLRAASFPHSTNSHEVKDEHIFQASNGISYTDDVCAALCYTHIPSATPCHYFIQYGGICMLGNYNHSGTYSAPASSFTAYFNESE